MVAEFVRIPTEAMQFYLRSVLANLMSRSIHDEDAMPSYLPTECPDCDGELREVTVIADAPRSGYAVGEAIVDRYAPADAKRSFWTGKFPTEGTVRSLMCQTCGRLFQYCVSHVGVEAETLEIPEAVEILNCLECGTRMEPTQQECPRCGWNYSNET